MRTLLFLTLVVFVVPGTWANEKMYSKLNKLYLTDRDKCLEKSKKLIQKNSQEAIPYYFNSVIYYDQSKESQTLRGTYLQLYRSVTNAAKFEKNSGDQERALVNWEEHIVSLKNRAERLISSLNKNEMQDLSLQLTEGLTTVESIASYFQPEKPSTDILDQDVAVIKESTPENLNFTKAEGQFYGLPTGKERIESANGNSEQELLQLINQARAKKNIPALVWSEDLSNASRYHAYDQGTQGYFSHASNDRLGNRLTVVGSTFDRIKRFYPKGGAGECIAAGNMEAGKTFEQWMNSDGHAKILMDATSKVVGIGFVQVEGSPHEYYWVLATGK